MPEKETIRDIRRILTMMLEEDEQIKFVGFSRLKYLSSIVVTCFAGPQQHYYSMAEMRKGNSEEAPLSPRVDEVIINPDLARRD